MIYKSGYLEWDSNFFNKEIAFIEARNGTETQIRQELERMSHFDLIYLYSYNPVDLSGYDAILVDRKRSYILENPKYKEINTICIQYEGHPSELYDLALQAGEHSRYKIDNHFTNEEFESLYKTWIDNSINAGFADSVLITVEPSSNPINNKITGFITAKIKGDKQEISIGLFATDKLYRGKGIGSALIQKIINIAAKKGLKVEVTTQADNHIACDFYYKRGFKLVKEEYVYHVWNNNYKSL